MAKKKKWMEELCKDLTPVEIGIPKSTSVKRFLVQMRKWERASKKMSKIKYKIFLVALVIGLGGCDKPAELTEYARARLPFVGMRENRPVVPEQVLVQGVVFHKGTVLIGPSFTLTMKKDSNVSFYRYADGYRIYIEEVKP